VTAASSGLLTLADVTIGLSRPPGYVLGRGIELTVRRGERVGLVGESGSGKTMTALSVMRLLPPGIAVTSGRIDFDGIDLAAASPAAMARIRGARISMVYQNPLSSLNPVRTIGWQISEAIRAHESLPKPVLRRRVTELLGEVGIRDPERSIDEYPHQFSGGMRQRVVIAMAISCEPELLLADEPTTALDVTTQARVLDLLDRLVTERQMAVVFVTHDLEVAASFCDRIDVMYAGRIVESGAAASVTTSPVHPYAEALVNSQCTFDLDPAAPMRAIGGQPPVAGRVPAGCAFHPRCAIAEPQCSTAMPVPVMVGGSRVECHVRAPVGGTEPAALPGRSA
jgi:peptide/nickel transport system ATP-binding protein